MLAEAQVAAQEQAEAQAAQAARGKTVGSASYCGDGIDEAFGAGSQQHRPNVIQNLEDMQAEMDPHSEQQPQQTFFHPLFPPAT